MSEETKIKAKPGPKPKKVDFEVLDELCKLHCTGEECASVLQMDYDTLNAALNREVGVGFVDYFKIKSAGGKLSLRRAQYKAAKNGNIAMQIWLGKNWLGQSDKVENGSTDIAEALKELAEKLPD